MRIMTTTACTVFDWFMQGNACLQHIDFFSLVAAKT
jgi:hypothetical protein